jgi:hypothetical protein
MRPNGDGKYNKIAAYFTFAVISIISVSGCGLLQRKVVYIPTPVPCSKVEIPKAPDYPVLTRESTPRQVMEYSLVTNTLQDGYIKQLLKVLEGYR